MPHPVGGAVGPITSGPPAPPMDAEPRSNWPRSAFRLLVLKFCWHMCRSGKHLEMLLCPD